MDNANIFKAIVTLKHLYGKTFVQNRHTEVIVRQVAVKNGRIIFHIPVARDESGEPIDDLVTKITFDEKGAANDALAGWRLPSITKQVFPNVGSDAVTVLFCRDFQKVQEPANGIEVADVYISTPEEARYLLVIVESDDGRGFTVYPYPMCHAPVLPTDQCEAAIWFSHRRREARGQKMYRSYFIFPIGYRLSEHPQTESDTAQCAEEYRRIGREYLESGEAGDYRGPTDARPGTIKGVRYADEMSGKQTWVIDWYGRLIRPDEVEDWYDRYVAEIAQKEIWHNVAPTCLVISWLRPAFDNENFCRVVWRPEVISECQRRRVSFIAEKIEADWRKRKHPNGGLCAKNTTCFWNLDEATEGETPKPSAEPETEPHLKIDRSADLNWPF